MLQSTGFQTTSGSRTFRLSIDSPERSIRIVLGEKVVQGLQVALGTLGPVEPPASTLWLGAGVREELTSPRTDLGLRDRAPSLDIRQALEDQPVPRLILIKEVFGDPGLGAVIALGSRSEPVIEIFRDLGRNGAGAPGD